jgi:serine/threonine-protein kinase
LREAQAMARLSHPNVVTVHEVGALGDEVYIAMEHVSGRTLRDFIRETQRERPASWRAIAEPFLQAGRGLSAAHHAGLVHRDFKPENVLLGEDGRVRVTDFGLVSTAGLIDATDDQLASRDDLARDLETPTPIPLSASITRTGLVVGTPAYMAPEQDRKNIVDERADQFSFCVSLWEALYGERPFAGTTVTEVLEAIAGGHVQEPPAKTRALVPSWVHDALLRGLARDPAQRWRSMDALLERLASDPEAAARQYRRWVIFGGVFVALAAAAAIGLVRPRRAAASPCSGARQELATVWNATTREKVAQRFAETGRSYAKDTFERAAGVVDGYASRWVLARTEACEATLVQHRQSDAALDLRMRCLDRRRAALAATSELWTSPISGDVVDHAIDAARALPALERCADLDALSRAVPPPESPDERRRADELATELDHLDALAAAGRFTDALPAAKEVSGRARKLGYAPVLARALYIQGTLEHELGDDKSAEATQRETIHAAAKARDDEQAARAWIALLGALSDQGRNEDALAQRTAAEAFVERAGGAELLDATLWTQLGTTQWNLGHFKEAEELLGRALDAREKAHGPKHPDVAESLEALGNVLADEGRYADARARLERAVAIREEALGPNHPRTASARNDLGMLLRDEGKPKQALASLEQALAVFEETLGREHADVGRILNNIGLAHADMNDNAGAEPFFRRALAIKEKALGPTHPSTALTLSNLGAVLVELGRAAEARPLLERAFEIQRTSLGSNHPDLALPHHTLGAALRLEGKCKDAIPHFMEAKAIWEKTLGTEHPQTSAAYFDLGVCYTDLGRTEDGLPLLEHALAIREKVGRSPGGIAEAKWQLGRALWESGKDKARGLALVHEARPKLVGLRQAREIDSWLAAHALAPHPAVTPGQKTL